MTFGFPVSTLPVSYEGVLKTTHHLKWIARQQAKEAIFRKTGVFSGIELPDSEDVLLGRGRVFQDHPGSMKLRNMVLLRMEEYRVGSKTTKSQIVQQVTLAMKEQGSRFLKRDDIGWWTEVSDAAAVEKVGSSFRTLLSLARKKGQTPRETPSAFTPAITSTGKRARISTDNNQCFSMFGSTPQQIQSSVI